MFVHEGRQLLVIVNLLVAVWALVKRATLQGVSVATSLHALKQLRREIVNENCSQKQAAYKYPDASNSFAFQLLYIASLVFRTPSGNDYRLVV